MSVVCRVSGACPVAATSRVQVTGRNDVGFTGVQALGTWCLDRKAVRGYQLLGGKVQKVKPWTAATRRHMNTCNTTKSAGDPIPNTPVPHGNISALEVVDAGRITAIAVLSPINLYGMLTEKDWNKTCRH